MIYKILIWYIKNINVLLSRVFSFNITLINDMTRAMTAISAKMLTIVSAFSRPDRRLHQLGFLFKRKIERKKEQERLE